MGNKSGTIILRISGMTCGGCAASVEKALRTVAGVESVKVDLHSGMAEVRTEGQAINPAELIAAVTIAGYGAQIAA